MPARWIRQGERPGERGAEREVAFLPPLLRGRWHAAAQRRRDGGGRRNAVRSPPPRFARHLPRNSGGGNRPPSSIPIRIHRRSFRPVRQRARERLHSPHAFRSPSSRRNPPADGHRPARRPAREADPQGPGILGPAARSIRKNPPSFKVENARRTYKCFGCGKGGDAFKWLTETEGLSFPEAVERLAGEAGVELPKWTPEEEAREEKKKSLYDVIEAACAFFEDQLRSPAGAEAREYIKSRGLNGEVAKKFRLGYAPPGHSTLIEHLKTKNITVDDMVAAGVVRPASEERGVRDFFYDRLMFPISDARGRIIAFGGRGLSPDAKPKYINTGETSLFFKGQQLYNFAAARGARDQGAEHRRGRRLYGRDRAGARWLRPCRGAARHRADRGPAPHPVAHRARTDPGVRRRHRRPQRRAPRRAAGAAASEGRLFAALRLPADRRGPGFLPARQRPPPR